MSSVNLNFSSPIVLKDTVGKLATDVDFIIVARQGPRLYFLVVTNSSGKLKLLNRKTGGMKEIKHL